MKKQSAGILLHRMTDKKLEVFLVHPGGPFWKNKDIGAWTIPKGELGGNESPLEAAVREFQEETGHLLPGPFHPLAPVRQKGGKEVFAWATSGDLDPATIVSNTFDMEWPPRSGRMQSFPEVNKGAWFDLDTATQIINPAQTALLAELANGTLRLEFGQELKNILNYWETCTIDKVQGGFYGQLTNDNQVVPAAVKGSVLNARILWSFSAAYRQNKDPRYLLMAERSLAYIKDHFIDRQFGGVYWSVTAEGAPADTKKQIYAIAFTIYGLTEYHRAHPSNEVLELAKSLYGDLEDHSYDARQGGYMEALTSDWQPIADRRLSDKDANEKKTMNTHLHILEAYTNLYRIWQDETLAQKIRDLIGIFTNRIVDTRTHHLHLFFDEDWIVRSNIISYGHDIEASWLLLEAAEALEERAVLRQIKDLSIKIAIASSGGLNQDGSMSYEFDQGEDHMIAERHWWVQAEAMVGFLNAWQLTGEMHFYRKFLAAWDYTKKYIIDHDKGEWFWGRNADGTIMEGQDKVGFWKCPYHNSRACLEVIRRLESKSP